MHLTPDVPGAKELVKSYTAAKDMYDAILIAHSVASDKASFDPAYYAESLQFLLPRKKILFT